MNQAHPFIASLCAAADQAAAAEAKFRRHAAEQVAVLERDRTFAFRRLNLMRTIADAAQRAENEAQAVADTRAVLSSKLGWSPESESHSAMLARFEPVARSLFASCNDNGDTPASDPAAALGEFENWYVATHRTHFWALFEEYMAETPRVDF